MRTSIIALVTLTVLVIAACGNPFSLVELVDGPEGTPLAVSPGSGSLVLSQSVALEASGGYPPYTYEVTTGNGSLLANVYTAPTVPGTETVRVSDSIGNGVDLTFTITSGGVALAISPSSQSVFTGDAIAFAPIGGTAPFTFAITDNQSGPAATIDPATGAYTAGEAAGLDEITVTDGDGSTALAFINVQARSFAISPSAAAATTATPTNTITFAAVGGTGPFEFTMFDDQSGGATVDINTGVYLTGSGNGTDTIRVTDLYDGRTRDAIVSVTAGTFVANVDYEAAPIISVTNVSQRFGGGFTADSSVTNNGDVAGTENIIWTVYASPDGVINGPDDIIVDTGVVAGGLAASGSSPIAIAGNWPPVAANFFLMITVAASDEVPGPDNTNSSGGQTLVVPPLQVSPGSRNAAPGEAIAFTASGVEGTATYGIVNLSGATLDPGTGAYTAGPTPLVDTVTVTDSFDGETSTSFITVVQEPVAISPASATVTTSAPTNTVQFSRVGGTGGFTFLVTDDQSGGASIDGAGLYTSGTGPGVDQVTMTYTPDGRTFVANVTVLDGAVVQNVDYFVDVIPVASVTSTETVGALVTATSAISNVGTADGAANLVWTAYASTDLAIGGVDDVVVDSGVIVGGLDVVDPPAPIAISGNWPATQGDYYLLIEATAADEIPGANNLNNSEATSFYVTRNVAISPTTFTLYTGQSLQLSAVGEGSGFTWDVPPPTDNAGGSVNATGLYTASTGTGTDTVVVTDTYDSATASAVITVIPTPLPDAVNYQIDAITVGSVGFETGDTLSGTIDISNTTSGTGAEDVLWTLYASRGDAILGPGDAFVDSGVIAGGIGPLGSESPAFAGNWPGLAGDYELIVTISAADETNVAGNEVSEGTFTITAPVPPDVDYIISSVPAGGSRPALGGLSENFVIRNQGTENGTQTVTWEAWLSTDTQLDAGDDLVQTNTIGALAANTTSGAITANGLWPADADPWPYYLIFRAFAGDDINVGNNIRSSGQFDKTVPGVVDYTVSGISANTTTVLAGSPINESVSITNIGTISGGVGTDDFDWEIFISADAIFDGAPTDTIVASDTAEPALPAGNSFIRAPIGGFWPGSPGIDYHIFVRITPLGADSNAGNNLMMEGPFQVVLPPDYRISSTLADQNTVANPGARLDDVGSPFEFTIENDPAAGDGSEPVTWAVYASLDPVLDGGDQELDSDFFVPQVAGATVDIDISASLWPTFPSFYYLIYQVSADDDENAANDTTVRGPFVVPLIYIEGGEDNDAVGPFTGPPPPPRPTSNLAGTLGAFGGQIPLDGVVLVSGQEGNGEASQFDTYQFILGPGVTSVSVAAQWGSTGSPPTGDHIDLEIYDENDNSWFSAGFAEDREPDGGNFIIGGFTPGETIYVTVFFLNPYGGDYLLFIQGL